MTAARLAQARKARETVLTEVKKRLPGLLARLETADDERAEACRHALAGRSWDLAAARSAATGAPTAAGGGELDRLRRLAQLSCPSRGRRPGDRGCAEARSGWAGCRRWLARWPGASAGRTADGRAAAPRCARRRRLPGMRAARCSDHAMAAGHPRSGRQAPPGGKAAESAELAAADARQRAAALMPPVRRCS